ncbi:MAG TPA: VWA domain-containing protein, partial [Sunxiuqinia sp.]|nr:VWA domain-containing protein [Sunxiuqinia sp.]
EALNYRTRIEPVNYRQYVTIKLKAIKHPTIYNGVELQEVVVTGYPIIQKKQVLLGSVSCVTRIRGVSSVNRSPHKFNTENYATVHESGYRGVFSHPYSTFSIDVDKASYSNVRRFLNLGQMPPVDAVRIEEMINYFDYNYKTPTDDKPYTINSDFSTCPWNIDHQLLLVGLKAKEIDKSHLPPSNLVFLLDVSGSMRSANKLPLVKSAMRMLVNELRPTDHVAIVVYAGAAGVVLPSTTGNQKQVILSAINQMNAGGSTAGGEGIRLAYQIARENFIDGGNNRIILATDGDFNVGVSSTSEMEHLVEKERDSGIFMTALGFGMGNYKDDKMETIADKGNGNYAYIDNLQEARKVFVQEFGATLFTAAKDVKLQLEFNPQHVKAYRLIGYENRLLNDEDFKNDKKDAGEMGIGHTVTALYEIIPAGSKEEVASIDELKYQKKQQKINSNYSNELVTIKTRFKLPDGHRSFPYEKVVPAKISTWKDVSYNLQFAAAVAGFGMLLRKSEYKGKLTYEQVKKMAQKAKSKDEYGYRGEFIRLVDLAESLNETQASK